MGFRLVYDTCLPTAERRPTTKEDIEEDTIIETFDTEEELLEHIANIFNYDEYDLEDVKGETPLEKAISLIELSNSDPGDGDPNFWYLSKDGEVLVRDPYECLEDVDFEHCTKEELIDRLNAADDDFNASLDKFWNDLEDYEEDDTEEYAEDPDAVEGDQNESLEEELNEKP